MTNELATQEDIATCVLCQKPLGQETRDMRIPFCHGCRKCSKCGIPVETRAELAYCSQHNLTITHARCLATTTRTADVDIELLNLGRLLTHPDPLLSRETRALQIDQKCAVLIPFMSHEQILLLIKQAEQIAASCSLLLNRVTSRKAVEVEIEKREKQNFKQAEVERKKAQMTPADRKQVSADELTIQTFMNLPGMTRETAEKMVLDMKKRKKEVLSDAGFEQVNPLNGKKDGEK